MKQALLLTLLALYVQYSESITVMSVDLGTEWMKIAIVKPGVPMEIVLNKESKRKTEVAVSMKDGERLFGSAAFAQGVRFPKNTYFYLLDILAKKMDHPLVQQYKKRFPYYDLEEDEETGYVRFRHDAETTYSPQELLAMLLNYARTLAEDYAEQTVDSCVITVPAYFNQAERLALLYSAELAGLKAVQLMDDNTASALNYGVFRRSDINASASYLMLYDMGASSTTATIIAYQVVKVSGVADPQLSVKGVGFDRTLGGLEMEMRLREHLIKLFNEKKKTKNDVRNNPRSMGKLLKEAGRVKKVLSANVDHQARIEGLIDDEDFSAKVSREDFEELCADLWPRVGTPIKDALESSSLSMDLISKIILVGGGTRVPKIQEILLEESGKSELGRSLNTDEAPALGASYEAAARSNGFRVKTFHIKSGAVFPIDIEFDRVTEHENGTKTTKHVRKTLFQRNNPYPQRKVITFNRFFKDFGFEVNYGDLKFLTEDQAKMFGVKNISSVKLQGVDVAHEKHGHSNETEPKGVKAHFRMDESGVLKLEEVESLFEANATTPQNETEKEDPSTFQKLKDSFSSLFGGGEEEEKGKEKKEDGEEKKGAETAESEDSKNSKEEVKDESQKEEKKEGEKVKGEFGTEDKKEAEEEKKETEEKTEEKGKEEKETEAPKSDEKVNATEEAANATKGAEAVKKPKKLKISVPINSTQARHDYVKNSEATFNASLAKLKVLAERDALKVATEEAMNNLEAYIYDKQDKLYQDDYEKAMTEGEQENITKALRDASDWMFELEEDAAPEVYKDKLKELRKMCRPWLLRVKERSEYGQLLKDMEIIFNYTVHFVAAIDSLPEDDQIYTEVEIKLLKTTLNDTITWKNETTKKQDALAPSDDNILKPDDIKMKIGALNREVQYLLNKARTAKPKKKPEASTNSTKTAGGKKSGNGTKIETEAEEKKTSEEGAEKKDGESEGKDAKGTGSEKAGEDGKKEETEKEDSEKTEKDTKESSEETLELPPGEETTTTAEPTVPPTTETTTKEEEEKTTKEAEKETEEKKEEL